jgi:hypothetical protein
MAKAFELISSVTVGSGGASSIDFTSIPSTYTDVYILTSLRASDAAVAIDVNIKFNGSDSSKTIFYADGTGAGTRAGQYSFTSMQCTGSSATASTFASSSLYVPNYAGTTFNKTFSIDGVTENNATTAYAAFKAGVWASTAAINQITFFGNFVQYSTAYLYGIKNA